MITIKIEFEHEGKTRKLQANLKNDLTISESKGNQATDIIPDGDVQLWYLIFGDIEDYDSIEAVMYQDAETGEFEVDYLNLWDNDGLLGEVTPTSTKKIYR